MLMTMTAEGIDAPEAGGDFQAGECDEGDGTPLQCSCLENPMDGGARWAAVCGVARVRHD